MLSEVTIASCPGSSFVIPGWHHSFSRLILQDHFNYPTLTGSDARRTASPGAFRARFRFSFPIFLNWQHSVPALVALPLTSPVRRSGLRHFDRRCLEATAQRRTCHCSFRLV